MTVGVDWGLLDEGRALLPHGLLLLLGHHPGWVDDVGGLLVDGLGLRDGLVDLDWLGLKAVSTAS